MQMMHIPGLLFECFSREASGVWMLHCAAALQAGLAEAVRQAVWGSYSSYTMK